VIVNILWDFMQLALRYHPDKNLDKPESTEKVNCFYTSVYIRSTILLCFLQYVLGNRSVTFSYFFHFRHAVYSFMFLDCWSRMIGKASHP